MHSAQAARRRRRQTLGLAAVLFLLVAGLSAIRVIRESEWRLTDTYFRLAPKPAERSTVVLVLVDEDSLLQYGRWPWSRELLGRLTHNLAQAGASVIGLDILLSEPQSSRADRALRDALQANARTVVVDKIGTYPDGARWIEPLPQFAESAAAVGHAQAVLDGDGICRRFPPREVTAEGSRWAFAVEVAQRADPKRTAAFLKDYGLSFIPEASAVETVAPVLVPIAFRRDGFKTIPAADALQGRGLTGLRGRPVLVGFGPTEISDRIATPLTRDWPAPGVEVHAQILDSILAGRPIHQLPLWSESVLLALACFFAVLAFRTYRGWAAVPLFVLGVLAMYAGALIVFLLTGYMVSPGPMILAAVIAPLVVYTADFVMVERSLTRQLRELRGWLAAHRPDVVSGSNDLSWKFAILQRLQTELGSRYELHETLLENTRDLVAIFDQHGRLLLKNRAFAAAWRNGAGLNFSELWRRLFPEDGLTSRYTGAPLDREAHFNDELYAVRIAPLPPTTLSPGGGALVTLTSLRTREERDRARAEALGFVTHELRTPLVAIQGFADLMMQFPGSPSCAKAPETIFRESKRLLALINTYLDVLRLDAGARPLRLESVDLEATVEQVFDILRPLATAANMRLLLQSDSPVSINGDAALIAGAILNLVSNAIKYGTPGGAIRVRCDRAANEVVLSVHNHGNAIAAGDIPRLFDSYYRAASVEANKTGSGLGLAFVSRIAEKHGGAVRVSSDANGTCFEIHLPAADAIVAVKGAA
jgi:signal transduction histidine kinase